uniref:Uncharacterized protein n=1 Tax=Lates calcarifer TaxID=8187 RepID=A0A4W6CY49_LATCA
MLLELLYNAAALPCAPHAAAPIAQSGPTRNTPYLDQMAQIRVNETEHSMTSVCFIYICSYTENNGVIHNTWFNTATQEEKQCYISFVC